VHVFVHWRLFGVASNRVPHFDACFPSPLNYQQFHFFSSLWQFGAMSSLRIQAYNSMCSIVREYSHSMEFRSVILHATGHIITMKSAQLIHEDLQTVCACAPSCWKIHLVGNSRVQSSTRAGRIFSVMPKNSHLRRPNYVQAVAGN